MQIYMTELGVSDLAASIGWWSRLLGGEPKVVDEPNGFALFEVEGGRLALKRGSPLRGTIHFQVQELISELHRLGVSSEVKSSTEGYWRAKLNDPDWNVVVLFQWVNGGGRR